MLDFTRVETQAKKLNSATHEYTERYLQDILDYFCNKIPSDSDDFFAFEMMDFPNDFGNISESLDPEGLFGDLKFEIELHFSRGLIFSKFESTYDYALEALYEFLEQNGFSREPDEIDETARLEASILDTDVKKSFCFVKSFKS